VNSKRRYVNSTITSLIAVCMVLAALCGPTSALALRAHSPAPSITVTPTSVSPHGMIQIRGTGFDSSTAGKPVSVSVSVETVGGVVFIGNLNTDSSGAVGGPVGQQMRLPFGIDAVGVDRVVVSEVGNTGLAAAQLITGTALQPIANNGTTATGTAGSQMTIHATGFAPLDTLTAVLGGQPLAAGDISNLTADEGGTVALSLTLPIDAPSGNQLLVLKGSANGAGVTDSASVTIQVLARPGLVGISPNPAPVGTTVSVQANGFQANEPVTFSLKYYDTGLNSYAMVNFPTDADNSGSATTQVHIPGQADPVHAGTITARGINSGATAAGSLTFATVARISITPPTAIPGSQVTIVGSGFVPRENLFTTTRLFKPPVGTIGIPDATGTFTATVTLLPTLVPGTSYSMSISGTGGDSASTTYIVGSQVPPAFAVSPTDAWPGAFVLATGQGFGGSESITFSISGTVLSVQGPPPMTNATGAFSATVVLPLGIAPGAYTVQAQGAQSSTVRTASLSVSLKPSSQWYFAEGFTGQGPSVFFHEALTLLNTANTPTKATIVYQMPDGSSRSVPVSIAAHSVFTEDVNADVGADKIVSAVVTATVPIYAERIITRTNAKKEALDSDVSPGQPAAQSTWYFAEGYSGVTFQPYLTVLNPFSQPVTMTVTLYPTVGSPVSVPASLVPYGRYTLNLRGVLPGKSFSTSVVASQPIVAERVEYWGDGVGSAKFGAGVKPGISSPGNDWYFGYSSVLSGDQSFVSIVNLGMQTAHITATVFTGSGVMTGTLPLSVAPGQRGTYELDTLLANAQRSPVAVHLVSDAPVIAEEAQYYGGSPNVGSHTGTSIEGRQLAAAQWSFASGDTALFNESEYIFNPSKVATTVSATFYGADGQTVTLNFPVPAQSVVTVSANTAKGLKAEAHGSVWSAAKNVKVVVVQVLLRKDGRAALADQGIPG
jgi:hypothetical protein